jgi:hypothetical protein
VEPRGEHQQQGSCETSDSVEYENHQSSTGGIFFNIIEKIGTVILHANCISTPLDGLRRDIMISTGSGIWWWWLSWWHVYRLSQGFVLPPGGAANADRLTPTILTLDPRPSSNLFLILQV